MLSSPTLRIAHVCILSPDLAATERFYTEGLGIRRVFRFVKDGELFGFYLDAGGGTYVEVFHNATPRDHERLPILHFCLEVEAIEPVRERLIALGIPVTERKLGADQSWQAWITEPGGVKIELHEYTAASSQRTGADCMVNW